MWDIVDYSETYFESMINMTKEYYGTDNDISNNKFIRHEYFNNPAGLAYIKLAYDREQKCLAGQYIVIPRDYSVAGETVKSVLSLNTLTREAYRGQKVFSRLAEAVYEACSNDAIAFCYGAPNQNSYPGFIKRLGFKNIGDVPLYLKMVNPFRLICDKCHITNMEYVIPKSNNFLEREGYKIIAITKQNVDLFDALWKQLQEKYKVLGVRDAKYMLWRYINIPLRKYTIYMAVKDGRPCGYLVGRIAQVAGMRCGMLVDMIALPEMQNVLELLIDNITIEFKRQRVGLFGCLMNNNTEEAVVLKRKGFFICPQRLLPQPFPIILRHFGVANQACIYEMEDFNNWFFTMGDYDVI